MSREDVLPTDSEYALVEISKGVPQEDAATKLFEFDDPEEVQMPPDGPLEFYVAYDQDGNEVDLQETGSEGDNPGGNDPETGTQTSEEKSWPDLLGWTSAKGRNY